MKQFYRISIRAVFTAFISSIALLSYAQINPSDYELSDDGKTLVKWKSKDRQVLDMQADDVLSKVTKIGDNAFFYKRVRDITLPNGLIEIGYKAFYYSSLRNIKITPNVAKISASAFAKCENLSSITVDSDNKSFLIKDGALMDREQTRIIQYMFKSPSSTYEAPSTVKLVDECAFYNSYNLSSVTFAGDIQEVKESAFYACSKLSLVKFGSQLTSIGDSAFEGCTSLYKIEIGSETPPKATEKTFNEVPIWNITLVVPPGVINKYRSESPWKNFGSVIESTNSSIPDYYYVLSKDKKTLKEWKQTGLKVVDMANDPVLSKVEKIGYRAFIDVSWSLETILFPPNLKEIDDEAFIACCDIKGVEFPSSLERIGKKAFAFCQGVPDIRLPEGLKTIGDECFYDCRFTRVDLPGQIESIGAGAFAGCKKLHTISLDSSNQHYKVVDGVIISKDGRELVLCPPALPMNDYIVPKGVNTINKYAFLDNQKLTSITFPEGVEKIEEKAVSYCEYLKTISIPASADFHDLAFIQNKRLEKINLAEGNKYAKLVDEVLYRTNGTLLILAPANAHLGDFVVPNGITEINASAFYNCNYLNSVTFPEGLKIVGDQAFEECINIESVSLPSTTEYIGLKAFANNIRMKVLKCLSVAPPTTGMNPFSGMTDGEGHIVKTALHIPEKSKSGYARHKEWRRFDNVVEVNPINQIITSNVQLYINESTCTLTVTNLDSEGQVRLYNSIGQLCQEVTISAGEAHLPYANLPHGVYMIVTEGYCNKIVL